MIETRASHRYAKAVLEVAHEQGNLETVVEDFKTLDYAIEGSRDLQNLLAKPTIPVETKAKLIADIFQDKVSNLVLSFLELMTKKGRAAIIPGVLLSFRKQLEKERGISPAKITSATELNHKIKSQIEQRLTELTGQSIQADYHLDRDLIGGFTARIDDLMIDASVSRQLERLHETLAAEASSWTPTL
ncbi:MAG: ATP synthase F1 subunit delta [Chlorobi bacterium]|nr:ATP synthase F1 subunit delta [Chlorobiota bacterium]